MQEVRAPPTSANVKIQGNACAAAISFIGELRATRARTFARLAGTAESGESWTLSRELWQSKNFHA
jgi:hypothetical protein